MRKLSAAGVRRPSSSKVCRETRLSACLPKNPAAAPRIKDPPVLRRLRFAPRAGAGRGGAACGPSVRDEAAGAIGEGSGRSTSPPRGISE
ncbi:hypothetical protein GCM10027061_14080 [Nesterenkonia suensis]